MIIYVFRKKKIRKLCTICMKCKYWKKGHGGDLFPPPRLAAVAYNNNDTSKTYTRSTRKNVLGQ